MKTTRGCSGKERKRAMRIHHSTYTSFLSLSPKSLLHSIYNQPLAPMQQSKGNWYILFETVYGRRKPKRLQSAAEFCLKQESTWNYGAPSAIPNWPTNLCWRSLGRKGSKEENSQVFMTKMVCCASCHPVSPEQYTTEKMQTVKWRKTVASDLVIATICSATAIFKGSWLCMSLLFDSSTGQVFHSRLSYQVFTRRDGFW